MPGLIQQIEQAVGGLDLTQLASGAGGQYGSLQGAIGSWSQGAPGGFGTALSGLSSVSVPDLSIAGSLGQGLNGLLPSLQGDLGGLVGTLQGDVSALPQRIEAELLAAVKPLFDRVQTLQTLLASDWTCGLVPGFAPAAAAPAPAPGPAPAPAPGPAPAPAPAAQAALTPAQVTAAKAMVDKLPADLNVESLLRWLHERVGTFRPGYFTLRSLPLVDDIRDPIDTLIRWDDASAAEVRTELAQTLDTLATLVRDNTGGRFGAALPAANITAQPTAALGAAAETYVAAVETLASAVQAANAGTVATGFTAAQGARAALLTQNAAVAAAAAANARTALQQALTALPGDLDAGFCRMLVLLQPRSTLADIADAAGPFTPPQLPAEALAPITEVFAQVQTQLQALLDAVDISAVAQPVTDALATANGAVQSVEQGLAQLSAQALAAIGQAREAVAALDLDALREQAENAIDAVTTQVTNAIGGTLGSASAAMGDAMTEVFEAMDGIDPEALAEPIREAIDALGTVIQQEAVQRLVQVTEQLEQLAQAIATLTFEPVADEVIALISELKSLIADIDISSLPDPGPALISEAMKVLPPSLVPLTDPLVVDLDTQINGSPIALLEQVKTLPDQARERLLQFSPRLALQPVLQAPFQQAVSALDSFSPTQWLAAGDAALAQVRQRLAAQMDIARLLAEPSRAFGTVTAQVEKLRPSQLLKPLEDAIEGALKQLANALPVNDLANALQGVLDRIRSFTGTVTAALDVATHLTGKLAALGDAQAQFDAWLDSVLAKVPATATGATATALDGLRGAADAASPDGLRSGWAAARAPLATALGQADAVARLTRLTLARGRIQAGLSNPALAAQAAAINTWLADAATRGAGDGLNALAALERALADADTALEAHFVELAERFPGDESALTALLPSGPATLREWVREAVQRQLGVPLVGFLQALKPILALVDTAATALAALVQALDDKLNDLLAAPQALADLLGSVSAVQQRLAGLDLGIYTREVDGIFQQFADELKALDPMKLRAPLEAARDRLLGQISLTAILPPALRGQLDAAHKQLVAKLGSLDPDALLLQPLDAEYRETVEPLVAALDISAAVQIIIDWLKSLPADLRVQIGRVDVSYNELLHSAPGGGGGGAGAGVSL